ncbi:MAG: hypothetical protein DDT22_00911 [candidate division WS2 bacterium]|nr:hypothetical protein [Candidatus Lithacetigena glycinireducens]MBT9175237.1 hypothetical protein [Candidatus Lithacetigena glycinireducens]
MESIETESSSVSVPAVIDAGWILQTPQEELRNPGAGYKLPVSSKKKRREAEAGTELSPPQKKEEMKWHTYRKKHI